MHFLRFSPMNSQKHPGCQQRLFLFLTCNLDWSYHMILIKYIDYREIDQTKNVNLALDPVLKFHLVSSST